VHSDFPNADLQNVFANNIKRVRACIDARGHQFQHLLQVNSDVPNALYILLYFEIVLVAGWWAEDLIVARKEIGVEVNVDETKYMVMSRDPNAGKSHNMKIDNRSAEMVEEFRYLRTNLTSQNSIQEEFKSRLNSGNACYLSVQNQEGLCSKQ
jgi:hypothetical protein